MNPNVDSPPGMHLPEPLPASPEQALGQVPQAGLTGFGEQMSGQQPALAPTGQQTPVDNAMQNAIAATVVPVAGQTNLVAGDDDKIEKEWVLRAKQIIASTQHDPYTQNKQLAAFKAEYIQKRYNKTIKLDE